MTALRVLLRRQCGLALAVVALALLVRTMVPQGWMPDAGRGLLAVRPCVGAAPVAMPMAMNMAGHEHHHVQHQPQTPGHDHSPDHERGQQPCAFGGLAAAPVPPELPAEVPLPPAVARQYAATAARFVLAQAARQLPPARAPPRTA